MDSKKFPQFFKLNGEGVKEDFLYLQEDGKTRILMRASQKGIEREIQSPRGEFPIYRRLWNTCHFIQEVVSM